MNVFLILSPIIGFLSKFVDLGIEHGLKTHKKINIILGTAYGILIALFIHQIPQTAPLAIAVIVGLILTNKIDNVAHGAGIASFILLSFFFGFPAINILFTFILLAAATLDEFGNDLSDKLKMPIIHNILKHRLILEITTLSLSIITGIWELWITIFLYDIAYQLTTLLER